MASPAAMESARIGRALLFTLAGLGLFGLLLATGALSFYGVPQLFQESASGPLPLLFLDWRVLLAAFDCQRLGVDVYLGNGCDPLGRVHVYPPLWLDLGRLGLTQADIYWSAPLLIAAGLGAMAWRFDLTTPWHWLLALAVACSPAFVFAYERANVDLLIYLLVVLAMGLYGARSYRLGYGGDLLVALAILLKIYPLALLPLVVVHALQRGTGSALLRLGLIALVMLGYSWMQWEATLGILRNVPSHQAPEAFGAPILVDAITLAGWSVPAWLAQREVQFLLYLGLAAGAYRGLAGMRWERLGTPASRWLLVAGTLLLAFCYFANRNLDYRLILVALLVPYLTACLGRDVPPRVRLLAAGLLTLLLLACWALWPLAHLVIRAPGGVVMIRPGLGGLMIALWAGKQLALGGALVLLGAIAAHLSVRRPWGPPGRPAAPV
jgi:hypothetical protein